MSAIIEATASRMRPTLRSASARSLLPSTYCSRVTVDNVEDTSKCEFPVAIGRPLGRGPNKLILMNFIEGCVSQFTLGGRFRSAISRKRAATPRSDVRFGSKAYMCDAKRHVCFTPESDMCDAARDVRFGP